MGKSAFGCGRRAGPARVALLRLEARQLAIVAQCHQRDVLRHAHALTRIDGAHDRHVRGEIGRREHLVHAGARTGDEPQRREARSDTGSETKREDRFDLVCRRGRGIGEDHFRGGERAQRGKLPFDERRGRQNENGHLGFGRELERVCGQMVT